MTISFSLVCLLGLAHSEPTPPVAPVPTEAPEPSAPAQPLEGEDAEEPKLPHWKGSITAGIDLRQGNTETISAAVNADAVRRAEKDRYTLRGWWNYGEETTNDVTSITKRNAGGSAQYDYFVTEKLYALATAGGETDDLANLDLRYYAGGGAGYQFYEEETFTLAGDVGLTYFDEDFADGTANDYLAAKLGYDVDWKFSEHAGFKQFFDAFPAIDDWSDVVIKLDTRLQMSLTESMIAQLQYVLDFDHTPAAGAKQTDHSIIFTLGWTFG